MAAQNYKLFLALGAVVVSAMCLEGLLGTNLQLAAYREGSSDTFDVVLNFMALDENGTAIAGAAVYCRGFEKSMNPEGPFAQFGTTDAEGKFSYTLASVSLGPGNCPKKDMVTYCYAKKGGVTTETVSDTVELWCRSAEASTSAPTAAPTAVLTQSCDLGCKSSGGSGGACADAGVIGPRCFEDVEPGYKGQVNGASGQVVSWMSSSISENYKCEVANTCYCYSLQNCGEDGCRNGKCVVPTACQAKGATGSAACGTIGRSCNSTTCSGGCEAVSTVDDPCGCIASCG